MSDRIYVKFYVDAVRSGLVADMGAERFQTLAVIASYMDANGRCFPSQETIAAALGIRRENANKRVKSLLAYKWRGRPVVTAERRRGRTEYTIDTEICFGMF
ncbi:helix-turn-helix domain-containing protein [Paenibacillus sp. 32O-W]|uniref:helix-turn-helix domain-containing protein n=1 Tax=Paenibacillus sp. 32O-W TaxID=1695218 RepID=UPI00071F0BC5|nr:helix-turn-helix domain-containing protein [Paenibacillus sp. 32O-W]ALS26958.1 helix-turn-helix domain-containing protein [Paenibacillus sp. 32O-W]